MAISASEVVPFTKARATLSNLAEQVKAGAEKIITKEGPERCRPHRRYEPGLLAPLGARANPPAVDRVSGGAIWTSRRGPLRLSRSSLHCRRAHQIACVSICKGLPDLYTVATPRHLAHLVSIRHHRELSFQFFWAVDRADRKPDR